MTRPTIKIALVGSHGVGKTGLANALAAAFIARGISTYTILETARELSRIQPGLIKINEETTIEAQARILEYQFERELEAERQPWQVVICDRSFDNYLYMERKFGKQQKYIDMILRHLNENPYSLIIKVPISQSILMYDGMRSVDVGFQKDIDVKLDEFLEKYGIKYLSLPEPVMPYREDWVYRIMKSLKPHLPGLI